MTASPKQTQLQSTSTPSTYTRSSTRKRRLEESNVDADPSEVHPQGNKGRKASQAKIQTGHARGRGMRYYTNHIAFYGGVLSNFHKGKRFSGASVLKPLLPKLDQMDISHPPTDAIATHIISQHAFLCGEQFMMAMKSYLFECPNLSLAVQAYDAPASGRPTSLLAHLITSQQSNTDALALRASTLTQILLTPNPTTMKSLGRKVPNFAPTTWDAASPAIVTFACLARAEADRDLAAIYEANFDAATDGDARVLRRGFVEGSSRDRVWGVGMGLEDPNIDDENMWKGENRLGRCHDEACRLFHERRLGVGRDEAETETGDGGAETVREEGFADVEADAQVSLREEKKKKKNKDQKALELS